MQLESKEIDMKILDLKKQFKNLYQPSAKKIEIVQVPNLQFAMIDGAIEKGYAPGNSPSFTEAIQALYGISYTLKFMFKKRKTNAIDYPVMALEGLLWLTEGIFRHQYKRQLGIYADDHAARYHHAGIFRGSA